MPRSRYHNRSKVSPHFRAREFQCRCCGNYQLDERVVTVLEKARKLYGRPLTINSGYRCPAHNKRIKGSPTSQHMKGLCADVKLPRGMDMAKFVGIFRKTGAKRIGIYYSKRFVHISVADQYRGKRRLARTWEIR